MDEYSEGRKWCDGLKKNVKSSQVCRSQAVSSDSSDDDGGVQEVSKKRKKKSRNDDFEDNRKKQKLTTGIRKYKARLTSSEKHGDKSYTPMQYCVWSEMHIGGVHLSLDSPPNSTMFH